jgi:hypothetical protein
MGSKNYHRLNWEEEKGIYQDKSFSYCNNSQTTIEKNTEEVTLYSEPATPGSCICCLFCATPFIFMSPCILSCILCSAQACSLSFQKRVVDEGRVNFVFKEKNFCSAEPPIVLKGARGIRMSSELRTNVTTDDDGRETVSQSTVIHFQVDHDGGTYCLKEMGGLTPADAANFCNDANMFIGALIQQPAGPSLCTVAVQQPTFPNTSRNGHMLASAPPMVGGTYSYTAANPNPPPVYYSRGAGSAQTAFPPQQPIYSLPQIAEMQYAVPVAVVEPVPQSEIKR